MFLNESAEFFLTRCGADHGQELFDGGDLVVQFAIGNGKARHLLVVLRGRARFVHFEFVTEAQLAFNEQLLFPTVEHGYILDYLTSFDKKMGVS